MNSTPHIFVTDFDGTMTDVDFYSIVKSQLLPSNQHDYWIDYREGKLTHFEALKAYFGAIRSDENQVMKLLAEMKLDHQARTSIASLAAHGWQVVIASAGCEWYIHKLLATAGIEVHSGSTQPEVKVYANPGHFELGRGLQMELPTSSPFFSPEHGINKAGIIEHYLNSGALVAFAGDGFPDVDAALRVPNPLRFARRDLASELTNRQELYRTFDHWSAIASELTQMEQP